MKYLTVAGRSSNKVRVLLAALSLLVVEGCVATYDQVVSDKIKGPKVITLDGSRDSWTFQIEKRLRERGFKIKRMAVEKVSHEKVSETKTETYNETSARYLVSLQGYAPNSRMYRCVAGGYVFDFINAELIDLQNNETIMYYSDAGHSEGCFPLSGTIFEDIAEAVATPGSKIRSQSHHHPSTSLHLLGQRQAVADRHQRQVDACIGV